MGNDSGDPDWEHCVTQSVINGNPETLRNVSGMWESVFRNADSVKSQIDDVIKDLKGWKGNAGDSYRENLKKISDSIDETRDSNKTKVQNLLGACAESLDGLQSKMPIPAAMYDQVRGYREDANRRNQYAVNMLALAAGPLTTVELGVGYLHNGSFNSSIFNNSMGDWVGSKLGGLQDTVDDFCNDRTKEAQNLLNGTNADYDVANTQAGTPQGSGTNLTARATDTDTAGAGAGMGGGGPLGGGAGGVPNLKNPPTGAAGFDDPYSDQNGYASDEPAYDSAVYDPGKLAAGAASGSGLAGAGGGPSGARVDSGLGTGGSGTGGVGRPVGLDGALGTGNVSGAMAGRGMMGGGAGQGAGHGKGDGDGRDTWLTEDEDPWGADDDAAPTVLGG